MPAALEVSQNQTTNLVRIASDLRADAGPIVSPGDILVEGNVRDGVSLRARGSIRISGDVEAAAIHADGNVTITGGIVGRGKATIESGLGVTFKYCTGATILSGADVTGETEIIQCIISARGAVRIPQGVIVGGKLAANGGVTCRTIGNAGGAATEVGVGFDQALAAAAQVEFPKLRQAIDRVHEVRRLVEPLMKHQKSLTAAQKEKASELLYEASEAENLASASIRQPMESLKRSDEQALAEIQVSDTLFAGVILEFPGVQTTIKASIQGPLKLTVSHARRPSAIVATDVESRKSCALESAPHSDVIAAARATLNQLVQSVQTK